MRNSAGKVASGAVFFFALLQVVPPGRNILIVLGLTVLLLPVAVAIHEAGHFVVALVLGFPIKMFQLGHGQPLFRPLS